MRWYLMVCLLIGIHTVSNGQGFTEHFFANTKDGKVYLRWTIRRGNTCTGIKIHRSVNGTTPIQIGELFGVCGSTDSAQIFAYVDSLPEPAALNTYELEFGAIRSREAASVYVVGAEGLNYFPNPVDDQLQVYFENTGGLKAEVLVYNMTGSNVVRHTTNESNVAIDTKHLPHGTYCLVVQLADEYYSRTIQVIH